MATKEKEDFMTSKWRPMMAMTYMATIIFDFILGPILYNLLQYWNPGQAVGMWVPLTLQGGGLYHLAMGAVLGISAWTRGQEKVASINNPSPDPAPVAPVMMAQPAPAAPAVHTPASAAPAASGGFGAGFNSGATPATTTGFGGKPAPAPQVDPVL